MAPKKKPAALEGGADSSSGRGSKRKPAEHEYAVHGKRVSRKCVSVLGAICLCLPVHCGVVRLLLLWHSCIQSKLQVPTQPR